jgi:hypothetical protein
MLVIGPESMLMERPEAVSNRGPNSRLFELTGYDAPRRITGKECGRPARLAWLLFPFKLQGGG